MSDGGEDESNSLYVSIKSGDESDSLLKKDRPLNLWQLISLNFFWFGFSVFWFVQYLVIVPFQVLHLVGPAFKGSWLGFTLLCSAVISGAVPPIVGALSDRSTLSFGKRRPFMLGGGLATLCLFWGLAAAKTISVYILFMALTTLTSNICSAPFNGLIPDVVPPSQRGVASAALGVFLCIGNAASLVVGMALFEDDGVWTVYAVIGSIFLFSLLLTVLMIREEPAKPTTDEEWTWQSWSIESFTDDMIRPLRDHDFRWVFITRFLVQQALNTVQQFSAYYVHDMLILPAKTSAKTAISELGLPMVAGALVGAILAGSASDHFGGRRRIFVYASSGFMIVPIAVMTFNRSFGLTFFVATMFGFGYGMFSAVDFAMVLDVLPSKKDAAKDLGIWHLAFVLPQALASPVAGLLLDVFSSVGKANGEPFLGYSVVFSVSIMYLVLGVYFVSKVQGIK